ncbi:peptidoglycan-binding protein [Stappia sp.]|uniref:peptidoglycan-binding protein n=1 Tax=Stappia sp. TaxID=1870903 RepID=UPI003A99320F
MSWNVRNRTSRGGASERGQGPVHDHDLPVGEDGWYAPQNRAPAWDRPPQDAGRHWSGHPEDIARDRYEDHGGARSERARARAQLDDVADALGRLMDRPDDTRAAPDTTFHADPYARPAEPGPNRQARRAAAARGRGDRRPAAASGVPPMSAQQGARPSGDARTSRIEAVLSALDRLDRRVEDLSGAAPAARVAAETQEGYYAPRPRAATSGRGAATAAAYAREAAPRYDERAAPATDDYDTGFDYEEARLDARFEERAAAPADDLRPLIQDLARRIDGANGPRDAQLSTLRREIADLRAALSEGLRAERARPAGRDASEMRRLSETVERLRADRGDMRLLQDMRAEIADLRKTIGQSNVEGMLQSLESGYAHLVQRLDEVARARVEPRLVDELTGRLADIESAFRIVPRADQIVALDDRVSDIGHRVEELVRRNPGEDMVALRAEIRAVRDLVERIDVQDLLGGIEASITSLSYRFDAIDRLCEDQRHLADRLSAIEERVPESGAVERLNDRLGEITSMLADDRAARASAPEIDERLGEIAGRLKRIESARQMPPSYDAAFTLLEKRLAAIDGKIDALDRPESLTLHGEGASGSIELDLISRLEAGIAQLNERFESAPAATGEPADLGALHREVAALRDSVSGAGVSADLEARLRDLADAASRGAGSSDVAVLAQVEDKIASLAAKLDAAEAGFSRLGDLGQAGGDATIAAALRDDLHRLMDAATSSEQRSREAMDSVQGVLSSINARLQALEIDGYGSDNPVSEVEDNRPLEPGSGVPPRRRQQDAAAQAPSRQIPMPGRPAAPAQDKRPARKVRAPGEVDGIQSALSATAAAASAAAASGQPQALRDRKADFIAAARRAAQAASEEAETRKGALAFLSSAAKEGEEAETGSAAGWLRSRLPGRRRKVAAAETDARAEADAAQVELQNGDRREGGRRAGRGKNAKAPEVRAAKGPQVVDVPEIEAPAREGEAEVAAAGARGMFSPGGRRAVLLAAAAVVIALGALQIFKQVSPAGDGIAALETPPVVAGTVETQTQTQTAQAEKAPAGTGTQSARTTSQVAEAGGQAMPQAARTGGEARPPAAGVSGGPEIAGTARTQPRAPASGDFAAGSPERPAPVDTARSAPAGNGEAAVAFAPPSISGSGFSARPDSIPAPQFSRTPSATATVAETEAAPKAEDSGPRKPVPAGALAAIPQDAGPIALREAAASGNPAAFFAIAVRYTEGTGVTPDLAAAARYYEKAADAGLAPAQYRLGSLYEKGRGVEKNLEMARDWYLRAAEKGNAKAAHNLAVLYAEGLSGTPEFRDAAYWFKKAAEFGLADSQYNLGILYARGLGLEKNLVESYKWFSLAAKQGDREAGNKRDEVANMLSGETLAEARLAAETWKETPRQASANEVDIKPAWTTPAETVSRASVTVGPRELVKNVQQLLAARGFDPGGADGQVGPRTRDAVRAYQAAAGLSVTGAISRELLDSLSGQSI